MSAAHWAWLMSLAAACVAGWLTARFDDPKRAIAGVVALVVASIGAAVAVYFEIAGMRSDQSEMFARVVPTLRSQIWNSVVHDIAEYDRQNAAGPLEEVLNEPLRSAIARNINQAREGYIELSDKNEVVVVALNLLDNAQKSVRATSYIDPKEWWDSDIGPAYAERLAATKQRVDTFQRIFIVESAAEARALGPVMKAQTAVGLEVKFICGGGLSADRRGDFLVVDSSVAAEMVLNDQRQFLSARFFSTKVRAEDFERKFNSLWVGARPASEFNDARCD